MAILGATGMLGNALYAILKDKYRLILVARDSAKISLLEKAHGGIAAHEVVEFDASVLYKDYESQNGDYRSIYLKDFLSRLGSVDYVINAIGIIPSFLTDPALAFFVNGAFPHILSGIFGSRLIHITTDCVYNGIADYPYNEYSFKTSVDLYGLSKSLGEPENSLVLRTSIVGQGIENHAGLLDWFLAQGGKTITGYANHFWNGITTGQFAKICDKIMSNSDKFPKSGIFHIFSDAISKYEMLLKFRKKFNVDCEIRKDETQKLDRTLATVYDFNKKLNIPTFDEMLKEI